MSNKAVTDIVTELMENRSQSLNLPEAFARLRHLLDALRMSIEEVTAGVKSESPDYTAIVSEVSVRVEAVTAVTKALDSLDKANDVAKAAVEQVFKKLCAPRIEQRVWRKLMLPPTT